MRYPRLATRLYNVPLLITREKAEVIEAVFRAHEEDAVATLAAFTPAARAASALAEAGLPSRSDGGYSMTSDGIALLPVMGTLVQRAGPMDAESGMTGYNALSASFDAAMRDAKVRGVMLEFDSGGGEVGGVFELADMIHGAPKPTYAYVNETACSAAYALAASAEKMFIAKTGLVGSVGVLMMHVDRSGADAKRGHSYTPIFAGAKKTDLSSHEPLSDTARAFAQANVDRIYDIFVNQVAAHRGINADTVRGTEAGLLSPAEAIAKGMADGTATFSEALGQLSAAIYAPAFSQTYGLRAEQKELSPMATEAITQAAMDAAVLAARTEATASAQREHAAAVASATAAASKASTERVKAILGSDAAKDRPALAQHLALETELPAEQAAALLAKAAPEAKAKPVDKLAQAMAGVGNVVVGADAGGEETEAQFVQKVVALHHRNIGRK